MNFIASPFLVEFHKSVNGVVDVNVNVNEITYVEAWTT